MSRLFRAPESIPEITESRLTESSVLQSTTACYNYADHGTVKPRDATRTGQSPATPADDSSLASRRWGVPIIVITAATIAARGDSLLACHGEYDDEAGFGPQRSFQ